MTAQRWQRALAPALILLLAAALAVLAAYRANTLVERPGRPSAWNEQRFFGWARAGRVEIAARALAEVERAAEPGRALTLLVPGDTTRDLKWWVTMALYHLPDRPPSVILPGATDPALHDGAFLIAADGAVRRIGGDAPR